MAKKGSDRVPDGRTIRNPTIRKKDPNANYDFSIQQEPKTPMGQGDFANLPDRPVYMRFDNRDNYRDGIINNFTVGLTAVSDIHENESKEKHQSGNA